MHTAPISGTNPNQRSVPRNDKLAIDQLLPLLGQLEFEQARSLARKGDYPAAQAILLRLLRDQPSPAVMDLLARIYAQQGLLQEARALWEKAIAIDPKTPDYAKGLAFLSKKQKEVIRTSTLWKRLLFLFGVVVILSGLVFLIIQGEKSRNTLDHLSLLVSEAVTRTGETQLGTPSPAVSEEQGASIKNDLQSYYQALQEGIEGNQEKLDELSSDVSTLLPTTSTPMGPPDFQVNVPGTTVVSTNTGFQVRFDQRLFLYGDILTENGAGILAQVGQQLEPLMGEIQINVVGFTDMVEMDNHILPLERGAAAVEYLMDNTRLPVRIFSISSGEGMPPPFPPNQQGDPYRMRTVLLVITFNDSLSN